MMVKYTQREVWTYFISYLIGVLSGVAILQIFL